MNFADDPRFFVGGVEAAPGDHLNKFKDTLKVCREIEARVTKVDKAERRIGLSIKAANYSEENFKRESKILDFLLPDEDALRPS